MSKKITNRRIEQLERDIESGIRSVGQSLMEIHSKALYKEDYGTFENYCKQRWGFSDRWARDMIEAETIKARIGTIVPVLDLKTKHLAEISKIPEKQQAQVTANVLEKCESENRKPTIKDFKEAAKPFASKTTVVDSLPTITEEEWEDVPDEPKPEPKPEPVQTKAEQARAVKSIIKQHNDAMMRAIDDLQRAWPNGKLHARALGAFEAIHEVMEEWMKVKK